MLQFKMQTRMGKRREIAREQKSKIENIFISRRSRRLTRIILFIFSEDQRNPREI